MEYEYGLRERQKESRRQRILESARTLFKEQGFKSATIREIAEAANVSPPTVHKYYGTKDQLLLDIVEEYYDEAASYIRKVSAGEPESPVDSITDVLNEFVEQSFDFIDCNTWRYFFENFSGPHDQKLDHCVQKLDTALYGHLDDLIENFKARGLLSRELDTGAACNTLQVLNGALFMDVLHKRFASLSDYHNKLRELVEFSLAKYAVVSAPRQ